MFSSYCSWTSRSGAWVYTTSMAKYDPSSNFTKTSGAFPASSATGSRREFSDGLPENRTTLGQTAMNLINNCMVKTTHTADVGFVFALELVLAVLSTVPDSFVVPFLDARLDNFDLYSTFFEILAATESARIIHCRSPGAFVAPGTTGSSNAVFLSPLGPIRFCSRHRYADFPGVPCPL